MASCVSALQRAITSIALVLALVWMPPGLAASTASLSPVPTTAPASEPTALDQAKQRLRDAQQRIQTAKDLLKNGNDQLA